MLAGLLYLATLDTGLQPYELHGGDLITHQYAQVQARPSNAPGYPIYTMGGWLWFHTLRSLFKLAGILHPNPIPILSAYSTLWALVSLMLLFSVVSQIIKENQFAYAQVTIAFLSALFLAVTYFFWYYATTTEQYSSAIAQTLAIIVVYLQWRRGPPIGRKLWLLAFLCGLSLAHMLTVAFIVPPLILVMLFQEPRLLYSPKAIAGSMLAALLPLTSYLYVWLRGAAHPEWWGNGNWSDAQSWFWSFVSTAQGRDELMRSFEPGRSLLGNGFPELIWHELSLPTLVMGIIGLFMLEIRLRWLTIGTLLIYTIFCWFYRFGNWFQVILPAYPILLIGTATFVARIAHLIYTYLTSVVHRRPHISVWLVHGLLVMMLGAAVLWRAVQSLPAADSRNRPGDTALSNAARLLDQPLPAGSGLFANVDDNLALEYLIDIWQLCNDVTIVSSPTATEYLINGRTVLVTWAALPTLQAELPADLPVFVLPISPDWMALVNLDKSPGIIDSEGKVAEFLGWYLMPNTGDFDEVSTSSPAVVNSYTERIALDREVLAGITLADIAVGPSPDGKPVVGTNGTSVDVILRWRMTANQWPEDVSISVRATQDGEVVRVQNGIIQQDHSQPIQWQMNRQREPRPALLIDPYRLDLMQHSAGRSNEVNGVSIVLYRQQNGQFEDLVQIDLPIDLPLHRQ